MIASALPLTRHRDDCQLASSARTMVNLFGVLVLLALPAAGHLALQQPLCRISEKGSDAANFDIPMTRQEHVLEMLDVTKSLAAFGRPTTRLRMGIVRRD